MDNPDAYAYDPIDNVDVPIRCHNLHQSVEPEDIDGSDFPVLIESNFRHDPVEACQGSFTEIREIPDDDGCPNCGYDRMSVSVHTLAGIHRETCRACGVDITERSRDDWGPHTLPSSGERLRQNAEYIASARGRGEGPKLWARDESSDLLVISTNSETHTVSIRRDDFISLFKHVIRTFDPEDDPFDQATGRRILFLMTDYLPNDEDTDD